MNMEPVRQDSRHNSMGKKALQPDLPPLTRNQTMVYTALLGLGRATKAYELLDILRAQGVKAAPTVYRALHELQDKGLVQHIVSSRSFVALDAPSSDTDRKATLICEDCGETRTIDSKPLLSALAANAKKNGFEVRAYHLEISTSCNGCDKRKVS